MEKDHVTCIELAALIKANEVIVIDVRSLSEFEEGHIWDAVHRPIDSLPNSVRDIPIDRTVVTVCNKGHGRSESSATLLREAGWKKIFWLEGGFLGWIEAGFSDYEPGFASS